MRRKTIGTCKDCQHFKKPWPEDTIGECKSGKIQYQYGCESDMLTYLDSEMYSAGHSIGEDFGCIHWEERVE